MIKPIQLAALTLVQIAALTAEEIKGFTDDHFAALSSEQLEALTIEQIGAMTPEQIQYFIKANIELKQQLKDMQDSTIEYKKEMEQKLASLGDQIAPDKVILTHDGKSYELKGKSIMIPGKGKIEIEKLKEDAELIALIVKKYPGMLSEI